MRTNLAHSDKHEPPGKVPPSASLEELVRVLVSRVISVTDSSSNTSVPTPLEELIRLIANRVSNGDSTTIGRRSQAEEIIFDLEMNGTRYLLMRMPTFCRTTVSLSCREQEIVRMVAQGHPNKIIADVLDISACTVGTHLRRIFAKLGVSSRAAMVACQLTTGAVGDLSAPVQKPTELPSRAQVLCRTQTTVNGKIVADDRNVDTPSRKAVLQRSMRSHGS
jgi:two-component system nitrate/nitrite response regulator NarL